MSAHLYGFETLESFKFENESELKFKFSKRICNWMNKSWYIELIIDCEFTLQKNFNEILVLLIVEI